jgi:hypothetical protein
LTRAKFNLVNKPKEVKSKKGGKKDSKVEEEKKLLPEE